MFKTLAIFFCILTFSIFANGQAYSPTLGRNNVWTGTNSFQFGKFSITGSITQCGSGLVMNGFQSSYCSHSNGGDQYNPDCYYCVCAS
jgi:hypothetical protein